MHRPVLMFLHRSYATRAVEEKPCHPLAHRYGPSVLATVKCATAITSIISDLLRLVPAWSTRIYFLFPHALNVAVTLSTLVSFSPRCAMAPMALAELNRVCDLFKRASDSHRARSILVSGTHVSIYALI